MKLRLLIFAFAAILAFIIGLISNPVPIEEKLIRIHTIENLSEFPNIENESIELQATLADMSHDPLLVLKAKTAMLRYPTMSRVLLPIYGSTPEFQGIFRKYGELALPAIYYFVTTPIGSIEWIDRVGKQYNWLMTWLDGSDNNTLTNEELSKGSKSLTPAERGWYAIQYIQTEGHDFIGQFVITNESEVKWILTERVMEGFTQFFSSGIRNLETRFLMDEQVEVSDIGWASLDVLVFASAVKVLRIGRNVAVTARTSSATTRSAALTARMISGGRLILNSARYAKWPLLLGTGYLIFSHPSLINDFLFEIAGIIDLPPILVQFLGWFLLLSPVLFLIHYLLNFVMPLVNKLLWSLSLLLARMSGKNTV